MMDSSPANDALPPLNDAQVAAFLKAHPDFLKRHPELLEVLSPPSRDLGESVLDFQQFQVKTLQKSSESLQSRYEGLVDFCRDNLSVQAQVHEAVLKILHTRSLESLLEVLTDDFTALFDIDAVRIGIESEQRMDEIGEESIWYNGGLTLLEPGSVQATLSGKPARLVEETLGEVVAAFPDLFAGYDELIRSCVMLNLPLETLKRPALLGFGVRHEGRFHPGQGIELLMFLSHVIALKLDAALGEVLF